MSSYDLFLRGLALYRTVSKAGIRAALELLNRAIALDPDYGLALALSLSCHGMILVFGWSGEPERRLTEARSLAQRAITAAGDDPEVLASVANGLLLIGAGTEAAPLAERAMALNPGSSIVWLVNGWVSLLSVGPELAFERFEASLRLDPLSQFRPHTLGAMGFARFQQKRFAEAVPLLTQSIQLVPDWPLTRGILAATYGYLGNAQAASAAVAEFRTRSSLDFGDWVAVFENDEVRRLLLGGIGPAGADV